jgi:hypothetical protein
MWAIRGAVMGVRGHTYAMRGNQLLNGGFSPLQAQDGDEAAHNASLQSLDQVCCIIIPEGFESSAIEILTQPQFIAVWLGAQAQDDIGFIVTAASSVWQNASRVKS